MEQILIPADGFVAVHRETDEEWYAYRAGVTGAARIEIPDEAKRRISGPWALVVGVGNEERTMYGTTIKKPCQVGDSVLVAQIGMEVRLDAPDGTFTFVYVIPFSGVMSHLEVRCNACNYQSRTNVRQIVCPKCGAGPERRVEITVPTNAEVLATGRGRL